MKYKMLLVGLAIGMVVGTVGMTVLTGGIIRFALTVLLMYAGIRYFLRRAIARVTGPAVAPQEASPTTFLRTMPMYPSFHADYHLLPERFQRLVSSCAK